MNGEKVHGARLPSGDRKPVVRGPASKPRATHGRVGAREAHGEAQAWRLLQAPPATLGAGPEVAEPAVPRPEVSAAT